MKDLKQEILSRTAGDLEKIEIALKNNMNPYLDIVSEVAGHILFSGGKRLRPLIMVLSSRICGYKGDCSGFASPSGARGWPLLKSYLSLAPRMCSNSWVMTMRLWAAICRDATTLTTP